MEAGDWRTDSARRQARWLRDRSAYGNAYTSISATPVSPLEPETSAV
jgi:hypothetical protein